MSTPARPKRLSPEIAEARDGRIVLTMRDDDGTAYQLDMELAEASLLVSGLNSAQKEAVHQPFEAPDDENLLPLKSIAFGEASGVVKVRFYVTASHWVSFYAPLGSPPATLIQALRDVGEMAAAEAATVQGTGSAH